jgi:hypothetical protein
MERNKQKVQFTIIFIELKHQKHIKNHNTNYMVFLKVRKLRNISGSLFITIPKQFYHFYGFKNGDIINIEPIRLRELRLRKL